MPEQIDFFGGLDLHHKSPNSGERQYKSRIQKNTIWSRSENWWERVDLYEGFVPHKFQGVTWPNLHYIRPSS